MIEEGLYGIHSNTTAVPCTATLLDISLSPFLTRRKVNVGPVSCLPAQHCPQVGLGQPPIQVEDAGVESLQQLPQSLVSLVHGQQLQQRPLSGGPEKMS